MVDNLSTEHAVDEFIFSLYESSELELSSVNSVNVSWENSDNLRNDLDEKFTDSVEYDAQSAMKKQKFRKVYFVALAVLLNPICVGYAVVYSSTATDDMQHRKGSALNPTPMEISWIGSILSLGALLGGVVAGPLTEFAGRKGSLLMSTIVFVVGWFTIAFAPSVPFIYCGRIIHGICCTIVTVNSVMYLTEISTPDVRGLFVASFQLFVSVGVLLASCIGATVSWSWSALIAAAMSVLTLLAMAIIPESPRWLMVQDRKEEALWTINFLQGDFIDAKEEIQAIQTDIESQSKGQLKSNEYKSPEFYKPVILSFCLMLFQNFNGVVVLLLYTVSIFKNAGSSIEPTTATIIVTSVQVVINSISSILVDRAGRKVLLLLSGGFMALSLATFGGFNFAVRDDPSLQTTYGWLPVICIMVCLSAFSLGLGPIPWLIIGEITTVRFRSTTSSIASALQSTFQFAAGISFHSMEAVIHNYGVFWTYASVCAASCFFTYIVLPETKGKTLEQIQSQLISKSDECNSMKSVEVK